MEGTKPRRGTTFLKQSKDRGMAGVVEVQKTPRKIFLQRGMGL
jgi:hypothetical protein